MLLAAPTPCAALCARAPRGVPPARRRVAAAAAAPPRRRAARAAAAEPASAAEASTSSSAAAAAAAAPWELRSWTWRGHEIRYAAAGAAGAKAVICVHGFGASLGHWRKNAPALAAAGYAVYAVDLLGFGASAKPRLEGGYAMEVWRDQLLAFASEICGGGGGRAALVGNSVGSLAALMAAAERPDAFASVTLVNCAGGMNNKIASLDAEKDDWRLALARPLFSLIDWILSQPALARHLFDRVRDRESLRNILTGVYPANAAAVDEALVELLHGPSCDPGALDVFVSAITGPPGPRPETLIPALKAPLQLIWGTRDSFTPADGPVGRFFQALPATRADTAFEFIEGGGHCVHDELEEEVNARLVAWLARHHA
jgi:pimeloyl-ACP methyl ester carboxylesterase